MMKKILMLALSSLMVLGLAACGNTNSADASSSTSKKTDTAAIPRTSPIISLKRRTAMSWN